MFQFPDLPPDDLCIQSTVVGYYSYRVAPFRYPRIKVCNDSPWHFAVCCVFLRLLAPRYSPCALSSLTNFLYILLRALNVFPGLLQKQNWYRYGFLTKYTVFRVHILATLYVKGLSLAKTYWQGWSNLINKWCDYNIKNRFNIYIIPKIITFKTSQGSFFKSLHLVSYSCQVFLTLFVCLGIILKFLIFCCRIFQYQGYIYLGLGN